MAVKPLIKKFHGETAKVAETAAIKWSKDLSAHEELAVESVETNQKGLKFVATITYRP